MNTHTQAPTNYSPIVCRSDLVLIEFVLITQLAASTQQNRHQCEVTNTIVLTNIYKLNVHAVLYNAPV